MRTPVRYGLALAAGGAAAGLSYLLTNGAVDPVRTWLAASLNAGVWFGFVALYVPVYDRLDGAPANGDSSAQYDAAKWGAIAGLVASGGTAGVPLLLIEALPGSFVAAVGLFAFGLVLLSMAAGMGAVATNLPEKQTHESADPPAASASSPADD